MCAALWSRRNRGDRARGKELARDERRRVAFRLAAMCGRVDVDGMLDEMTPEQFSAWVGFDHVEGIGSWRLVQALSRVGSCVAHGTLSPEFFTAVIPPAQTSAESHDVVAPQDMATMFRTLAPENSDGIDR